MLPLIFSINVGTNPVNTVCVYVDGRLYTSFDINDDIDVCVNTEYGYNNISVKNKTVSVSDSDCKNGDCVKMSAICDSGGQIVCLPHHLEIRLIDNSMQIDSVVY